MYYCDDRLCGHLFVFRMTFTLYLVEMSEFLLFDDRKRPYHLMLMHFDKFNGLSALTE